MADVITRASYQAKRLDFLKTVTNPALGRGLEIGACDLPTIPASLGPCEYADFRSARQMIELWNLPPETVVPVRYIVKRDQPLSAQIDERFDYVVACHVIEHVPDPIGYIIELGKLLREGASGFVILAAPDKRQTLDATRNSTSIEHILMDFHDKCAHPTIEHIMEFGHHWSQDFRDMRQRSLNEFYSWAARHVSSEEADAHCHVWTDQEFIDQMKELTASGIIGNLSVAATQPTMEGYNEFMIAFRSKT